MGLFNFLSRKKSLTDFLPGRPSRQSPPDISGWYRFFNKTTQKYDYTGITNNLKRRYKEHTKTEKFNSTNHIFEWKTIKKTKNVFDKLKVKEIQKIKKYVPPLNGNRGGGGRRPKEASSFLIEFGGKLVMGILKNIFKK